MQLLPHAPSSMGAVRLKLLAPLEQACFGCTMCELGFQIAEKNGVTRDPHVFSSMTPSRFMVVGQNPGWDELEARRPFIGAAGRNFDLEIAKHGLTRQDFYICNTVRCFTKGNQRPSDLHKQRCSPFLQMELNTLHPILVVVLGAVAFSQFCPTLDFSNSLGKIVRSEPYQAKVFPVYHPSPMNLCDQTRRQAFERQVTTLCALIKAWKETHEATSTPTSGEVS